MEALKQEHQSDLCHKKAQACAVEPLPNRSDDDREKQHVKEIRAVLAAGVGDQPQTRRNQCGVDGCLKKDRSKICLLYTSDAADE